ncbi:hypothetical protein [Paenibacillus roseipurpureus]|uniref:Uncharacterized protein n=1 Tax=Paenibacillus roseopurpureus TaxID=2918901 RepID=A0AA96RIU9_9BACL|nr:hypothetical protein [Paenibacillus sp. MBLB1832]WNR42634.1 hypothetical protein MJB10_16080 [Paenibacillus sp. MBLB1832]
MGTRLRSEQQVKLRFPHLRYIRIYTSAKYRATIYAWTEDMQLSRHDALNLERYANAYLYPHVVFTVKAYNAVRADRVPLLDEVPVDITQAALRPNLNQYGIFAAIHRQFPRGRLSFQQYDAIQSIIHFTYDAALPLSETEKGNMLRYLCELIPLGCYCEVHELEAAGDQ